MNPKSEGSACHNFYPQQYTGLSLAHFNKCNEKMKSMHLPVAAFISSNSEGTYGPWPVNEGLCTLEMHRGLEQRTELSCHGFFLGILGNGHRAAYIGFYHFVHDDERQ